MVSSELTPRQVVAELDKYIVGQNAAKRAVAIALRNRYRRQRLPQHAQEEIYPKNILMIGPTGVGKTEIARRLARLVKAPFVKIEATKFTEVGYVGRDVESMVRDLVETAIRIVRAEKMTSVEGEAKRLARERILDILAPMPSSGSKKTPLEALLGSVGQHQVSDEETMGQQIDEARKKKRDMSRRLDNLGLEDEVIEIETEDQTPHMLEVFSGAGVEEMGINIQDLLGGMMPRRKRKRRVTVAEAKRLLTAEEAAKLVDQEQCTSEAIDCVEQSGIIFIDEIDKVCGKDFAGGPDVSREGVQRDILPIVEGSTVMSKHGPVKTDHILFIAAGAFHQSKPSDLIPELQGRFPIRVELEALTDQDLCRILTEPKNALTRQYVQLLSTEGVTLEFSPDAIAELADLAVKANERSENIGARRLHTLLERVLDELSFEAPDVSGSRVVITADYVRQQLGDVIADSDLSRYIL